MIEETPEVKYKRPSWDEYFMEIMEAISKRGTCDRGRSGCVIAKNKQIISAGYVGSAAGDDHCDDVGHLFQKRYNADGTFSNHCVRTVHAEQNAICQAAKIGASVEGATLYCRMTPCPVCAKMIINCGIKRVVCQRRYHDGSEAERVFARSGVALVHMTDAEESYAGKGDHVKEDALDTQSLKESSQAVSHDDHSVLKISKIYDEAVIPSYAKDGDAGLDLVSIETVEIPAGGRASISTGLAFEIPTGSVGLIWDRSGLSHKKGLKTLGGVIDSGYRGEVKVGLANVSREAIQISTGDKIAQMLIQPVARVDIEEATDLSDSERGEDGFGSTDLKKIEEVELNQAIGINQPKESEGQDEESRW